MGRRSGMMANPETGDPPRARQPRPPERPAGEHRVPEPPHGEQGPSQPQADEQTPEATPGPTFDLDQLSAIVDAVADGITVQGPDGRVVFANLQAARASGFESPAAMLAAGNAQILSRFELLD